jgi:hypothetical protein
MALLLMELQPSLRSALRQHDPSVSGVGSLPARNMASTLANSPDLPSTRRPSNATGDYGSKPERANWIRPHPLTGIFSNIHYTGQLSGQMGFSTTEGVTAARPAREQSPVHFARMPLTPNLLCACAVVGIRHREHYPESLPGRCVFAHVLQAAHESVRRQQGLRVSGPRTRPPTPRTDRVVVGPAAGSSADGRTALP